MYFIMPPPTSRIKNATLSIIPSPLCYKTDPLSATKLIPLCLHPTTLGLGAYLLGNKLDVGYQSAFSPLMTTKGQFTP